jgi:hypothetical protein
MIGWMIVKDDELERMWSWPNLRYYPSIFLEGLKINHEKISQDRWCPEQTLNQLLLDYITA